MLEKTSANRNHDRGLYSPKPSVRPELMRTAHRLRIQAALVGGSEKPRQDKQKREWGSDDDKE